MPHIDVAALVQHYGLLAVFVGALLEGETVLLLAAASAHFGLLDLREVLGIAVFGAFIGDNAFFLIGRHYGPRLLERVPRLAAAVPRVDALLARWRWLAVIALRFMYGLRMAGPMVIGAGRMPEWEFALANFIGALLWAGIIGAIGYTAGHAVETMFARVAGGEKIALAVAVAVGGIACWRATCCGAGPRAGPDAGAAASDAALSLRPACPPPLQRTTTCASCWWKTTR
jgi:membrane protein DedA with SNARE-associated domain